ncbi:MAG: hypothetical protein O8C66_02860 [Candidatus Methanoperedens sp.]|nr:hypothetical protein [Candidatus Methanoperedens sp.]MCZ7369427.1 hypothetical protein [Candidatus Methanoperedens sp.]
MSNMSEDALFKALLKNKPPVQAAPKPQVRKEPVKPVPPAPPVETYEEKPVVEVRHEIAPLQADAVAESIKNLTANVNMIYGLMKTVIVPVLVLILIVGIGILIKR